MHQLFFSFFCPFNFQRFFQQEWMKKASEKLKILIIVNTFFLFHETFSSNFAYVLTVPLINGAALKPITQNFKIQFKDGLIYAPKMTRGRTVDKR